ncbi:hypothetical protein [Parafrankia sp. FMc2]|uniref:hypothetical protein n=1 Tax=Parafrankia sp. FMc2 TaxID=3233196 RepID=UPI0034D4802B
MTCTFPHIRADRKSIGPQLPDGTVHYLAEYMAKSVTPADPAALLDTAEGLAPGDG